MVDLTVVSATVVETGVVVVGRAVGVGVRLGSQKREVVEASLEAPPAAADADGVDHVEIRDLGQEIEGERLPRPRRERRGTAGRRGSTSTGSQGGVFV